MRIALFCPSYGQVGGIETKADVLIDAFRSAGHEVVVLARGEASTVAGDVPVVRRPYHQLPRRGRHVARQLRFATRFPAAIRALRHAALEARADVVLALAISSYAPYATGLARTLPLVLSLEGGGPGFARNPRAMRAALRRARRVVAVATPLARAAADLLPDVAPRLSVIPNGVDPDRFATAAPFPHPRRYLLTVARLSHEKGIDVLLDAFARLGVPELDLVVVGDGPERAALIAQRDRLGITERVHFVGTLEAAALPARYRGATLVVCPSRWEGLPLVALEAMASGRAVVGTAVDGMPDAVADGETGILVPPEDPGALAGAIAALLQDPARAATLGRRGATVVRERFTWNDVCARYLAVLREAIAG